MAQHENQKLIRCKLTGAGGQAQTRLVEFELFKLWQFMMQSKHSFDVSELTMCLWVNEATLRPSKICTNAAAICWPLTRSPCLFSISAMALPT